MIKVNINGKEYKKDKPTIKDWYYALDNEKKVANKEDINILLDRETVEHMTGTVSNFFNINIEELEDADMEEITVSYARIQKAIIMAFNKSNEVWGESNNKKK